MIKQHEEYLKDRQASFERALQKNEERERSILRKRMQEEMYSETLRILKDLESDLNTCNRKKIFEQREKELQAKKRKLS